MGAYANRRKFVTGLRGRPQIDNKDCTGGYDKRLREKNLFGAARISWMSAKGLWRIDEGQVIIEATHCKQAAGSFDRRE